MCVCVCVCVCVRLQEKVSSLEASLMAVVREFDEERESLDRQAELSLQGTRSADSPLVLDPLPSLLTSPLQ